VADAFPLVLGGDRDGLGARIDRLRDREVLAVSSIKFRPALPHELDGPGPTKADLPLYVTRVEDLQAELEELRDNYVALRLEWSKAVDERDEAIAETKRVQERWQAALEAELRKKS